MLFTRFLLICLFFYSGILHAHGPTRQKVKESIEIKTPASVLWKMVRNLESAEKWHSEYSSLSSKKEFLEYTSKRDGSKGLIEILSSNDESMKFKYRLKNPGSIPVNNYSANVSVKQVGNSSSVTFKGAFYRKYVNNDPPPGEDDEAAIKAITEIYRNSLKTLKTKLEGN